MTRRASVPTTSPKRRSPIPVYIVDGYPTASEVDVLCIVCIGGLYHRDRITLRRLAVGVDAHCIECDYHAAPEGCEVCADIIDASGSHPEHDGLRAPHLDGWTCRQCAEDLPS
jgi:hypothetical protein